MQKQDTQYAILTLTSLLSSGERQAVPLALSVYRRVDQSSLRHRVEWVEETLKNTKEKRKTIFFFSFFGLVTITNKQHHFVSSKCLRIARVTWMAR